MDAVVNEFENKTPANPNKGIYQTDVDAFGDPPDVDNDPRIIILILDIRTVITVPPGGYTAGYFSSNNETPSVPAVITQKFIIWIATRQILQILHHPVDWKQRWKPVHMNFSI